MRRSRLAPRYFRPRVELLEGRHLLSGLTGPQPEPAALPVDSSTYDANSLLVRFRTDSGPLGTLAGLLGNASLGRSFAPLVPGLAEVNLGPGLSVSTALALLRASPFVEYAEPDYLLSAQATVPNDPSFGSLFGLNNTGQSGGTADADIDAPEAWEITTGSSAIVVAVIDSGIDFVHPDLAANIWTNPGEIAADGLDNDGNGFIDDLHGWDFVGDDNHPQDDHSHGTHVAGTIGAIGDNGIGIAGVNWNVQIMPLKFLSSSGSGTTADAIAALNYAVANGARVSNHSYGGGPFSQAHLDALNNALAGNQHLAVAAAGNGSFFGVGLNNDTTPYYPASYQPTPDNLISVAATDNQDKFGSFSNYGATSVDLAAPGVSIYSTVPVGMGSYGTKSGTSMAAPHVAGAAALVWSVDPSLTAAEVKALLLGNTDSIASLNSTRPTVTKGRLNVNKAVRAVVPPGPPNDPPTVELASPLPGEVLLGTVALAATADDDLGVTKVEFFAGEAMIGQDTDGSDGWTAQWDTTSRDNGTVALTAKATDTTGQTATSSSVSVTLNNPAPSPTLYFSLGSGATLGGISFANEDIIGTVGTQFSKVFDGSDVGVSSLVLDAFALLSDSEIVMSFTAAATIGGLSVDDSDLVKFTATSLGETTAGTWSMYFDASDVGLTTDSEDVDAVEIRSDGSMLLSTTGAVSVSGASAAGEDLLRFVPTRLGSTTAGSWSIYFDGSDVSLNGSSENVDALAVAADGQLYLSTTGNFSVPSRSGGKEDIFVFTPTRTGSTTAGSYSSTLAFDGSTFGLSGNNITALDLPLPTPAASSASPASLASLDQFFFDLLDPKPKNKRQS